MFRDRQSSALFLEIPQDLGQVVAADIAGDLDFGAGFGAAGHGPQPQVVIGIALPIDICRDRLVDIRMTPDLHDGPPAAQ